MVVMGDDKELVSKMVAVDANKQFNTGMLLFPGRAEIFFSPSKTERTNDLEIDVESFLDSSYQVMSEKTIQFTVGANETTIPGLELKASAVLNADTTTLENVEVLGKQRTPTEKFMAERVTGMFRSSDSYMYDGINNNQFVGFANIIEWLRGRVPGLMFRVTGPLSYTAVWQGGQTLFFLDEMQVDAQTLATLSTADIAMVKVYRPPFYGGYLGGAGGAVAVYTKTGSDGDAGPKNHFGATGYTPYLSLLPFHSSE